MCQVLNKGAKCLVLKVQTKKRA